MADLIDLYDELRKVKAAQVRELTHQKRGLQNQSVFQSDPIRWCHERLNRPTYFWRWNEYPGYDGHKWDGTPNPLETAWMSLVRNKHVAITSCTGGGKTFFAAHVAYWFLECFDDSKVILTSASKTQLMTQLWAELTKLYPKFSASHRHSYIGNFNDTPTITTNIHNLRGQNLDDNQQAHNTIIARQAQVNAGEESATRFQGNHAQHMLHIVDEAAGVNPAIITAIKNTSTDSHNLIMLLCNPDSITDPVGRYIENNKATCEHIIISAYDHPNVVSKAGTIPGATSNKFIEDRINEYSPNYHDNPLFLSRVRGRIPQQSKDALIKYADVMACWIGSEEYKERGVVDIKPGINACGVDVAASDSGDKASTTYMQGNVFVLNTEFACPDPTALALSLVKPDHELDAMGIVGMPCGKFYDYGVEGHSVAVDVAGPGAGVPGALKNEGYDNIIPVHGSAPDKELIPTEIVWDGRKSEYVERQTMTFNSQRSQLYYLISEAIKKREVLFDLPWEDMDALAKELSSTKREHKSGKWTVEPKEALKKRLGKSPNRADSLVYCYYASLKAASNYNPMSDVPFMMG